jgi:diguanylate cyclase (GGDEF)-like protein
LLTLMPVSVLGTAAALPYLMGWQLTRGAWHVVSAGGTQALAWLCFALALPVHDRIFSSLWIGFLGLSFGLIWAAVCTWSGRWPARRVLQAAVMLTPLGYFIGFGDYAFRVAWSNTGLSIAMLCVCAACWRSAPQAGRRWRELILVSLSLLALVTLGRGVLGGVFTELYPALRTPHPLNVAGAIYNHVALMLTTLALMVGWREEADRGLRLDAETDHLTGLLNRRAWLAHADAALLAAQRYGESLAVLLIDVDHFKQINDSFGHAAGDHALVGMGQTLKREARAGDLACRWGGEEFCVLVRKADLASVSAADARLRRAVQQNVKTPGGRPLTFSSGLAISTADTASITELVMRADEALYLAKSRGRDRLISADRPCAAPAALSSLLPVAQQDCLGGPAGEGCAVCPVAAQAT